MKHILSAIRDKLQRPQEALPDGNAQNAEKKKPKFLRKKKLTTKKLVLLCVGAGVLIGGSFLCYRLFFTEEEAVALTDFTLEGALTQSIEGTGVTTPADSVTYSLQSTTAEVLEVCVKAGDSVEVGDILFRQDDSEVDEQIEEYEDDISDYELDLQSYEEQLESLQESMGNSSVTAPISGRVVEITADVGDDVMNGSTLCKIYDDSVMKLTQYFSYAYEADVYIGMPASVSVSSQAMSLSGTVTAVDKVSYVTSGGMQCFSVTVEVTNPGSLTEGLSAACVLSSGGTEIYPATDGTLEYADSQSVQAKVSGELLTSYVEEYSRVSKGQTLFYIDSEDSSSQIENIETQIERLKERIAAREEDIAEAEESRENYYRTSEIAGTVISCSIEEGTSRQMAMQSVTVYNLDTMTIDVNIDELDEDKVYEGQPVTIIRSGSDSDTEYSGYISYLSIEASGSNGVSTFPCTITIESDGALTAGVNVSYIISTGDTEEGVLAPIAALKTTDAGTCLFVKADTRPDNAVDLEQTEVPKGFYAVPVEVGSTNSDYARILSGVEAGVEVFTRYQQTAPSGGDTTSTNGDASGQSGGMPDFSGGGGNFGGGGMPSGGGMPGGMP